MIGPRHQGQQLDAPPPATCSHPAARSRTEPQGQWAMGTLTTHVLQATVKWDTCSSGSPTHACRMHWASAAPHGQRPHKCHLHHTLSDGNSWPQCRWDPVQNPALRHGYFLRGSGLGAKARHFEYAVPQMMEGTPTPPIHSAPLHHQIRSLQAPPVQTPVARH